MHRSLEPGVIPSPTLALIIPSFTHSTQVIDFLHLRSSSTYRTRFALIKYFNFIPVENQRWTLSSLVDGF
jgi:hypothetical protein